MRNRSLKFIALVVFLANGESTFATNDCDADRKEKLVRLATYSFSLCLTESELRPNSNQVLTEYVASCEAAAKAHVKDYLDSCSSDPENEAEVMIGVAEYSICKNLQILTRATGTTPIATGDDREICAGLVINSAKRRLINQ